MDPRLSLESLEGLVRLLEKNGSVTEAARSFGIYPSAMSKRVRVFLGARAPLDSPWLIKRGRSWSLTEEGQRNIAAVREIVNRYHRLEASLGCRTSEPSDVLVGCGQWQAKTVVRQAVVDFQAEEVAAGRSRPTVRVQTLRGKPRIEGVATGAIGLALTSYSPERIREVAGDTLRIETLFRDSWRIVAADLSDGPWRRAFQKAQKAGLALEALADLPLILPEPDSGHRQRIDGSLLDAIPRNRLDVVVEVGGWETLLDYAAAGLGVALVPASTLAGRTEALLQAPVRGLDEIVVHLIRLPTTESSSSPTLTDRLADRLLANAARPTRKD